MKKLLFVLFLSLFIGSAYAQSKIEVKGTITEAGTGYGVPGATIIEKGTSNGAASDFDGNFTINVSSNDAILVVSFVGFVTTEVKVDGQTHLNIALEEDVAKLDEIVVVGYSSQKRESLTGALNTIKGEDLKNVTTPSVENMLNGKAPGVYVATGSGQPGSRGAVVIRGQASLSGTVAPLWVIDGVIVGQAPVN